MAVEVRIPAHYVSTGWGTPTVCVRHGEAAVERKKVQFLSAPPGWAYLLLLAGVLPFLIVVLATRKTVDAREWPFCPQCRSRRTKGLLGGLAGMVLGVLAFTLVGSVSDDAGGLLMLLGIFVFTIGFIFTLRSANRMMLADGRVIEKGTLVQFRKAHEAFAGQAAAAAQAAAQHHAAQHHAAQHHAAQAAAQQAAAQHYAVPPAPVLPPTPVLPDATTAAPTAPVSDAATAAPTAPVSDAATAAPTATAAPAQPAAASAVPAQPAAASAAPAQAAAAQSGVAEPSPAQPTSAADGASAS